jgi:hypothetical protein
MYISQGINGAWPFLAAEVFKAEKWLNAIPEIHLHDQCSLLGQRTWTRPSIPQNQLGLDPGYYVNPKRNYAKNCT